MIEIETILATLNAIADPLTGAGVVDSKRVMAPRLKDGALSLVLEVSNLSPDQRDQLDREVHTRLEMLDGLKEFRVAMTSEKRTRRIIAVASGKGGVGKSTVSVNLAVALAKRGIATGLVDADIYGPSQPTLTGTEGQKPEAREKQLIAIPSEFGVPVLSMGHLVKPGQAVAWRGPMAGNALSQLVEADWGNVDVLIVDMPPGTGDVQLSMVQKHKPVGAIIVSTPQDLALIDASRAIDLFNTAAVPVIGLVENMSGYACPACGDISAPFGAGGVEAAAKQLNLPFLGTIPLSIEIRMSSDNGTPSSSTGSAMSEPFDSLAAKIATWLNNSRSI